MARPKFKIETKLDKRNFLKYLENNREKVLSDLKDADALLLKNSDKVEV